MKVTVTFGRTGVVVPCKEGWTVRDLIQQATQRYRKLLEQVSLAILSDLKGGTLVVHFFFFFFFNSCCFKPLQCALFHGSCQSRCLANLLWSIIFKLFKFVKVKEDDNLLIYTSVQMFGENSNLSVPPGFLL